MPATIRLTRMGRKKRPFYRVVVVDSRARRDGDYIEKLGYYNPFTTPYEVQLDHDKAVDWLARGAGMSETARALLRNEGVLYRWHLQKSGSSIEEIETKVEEFRTRRGAKVEARRRDSVAAAAEARRKQEDAEKERLKAAQKEVEAPAEEPEAEAGAEDAPAAESDEESGA
jgi:small subunit ribosomal protein S16